MIHANLLKVPKAEKSRYEATYETDGGVVDFGWASFWERTPTLSPKPSMWVHTLSTEGPINQSFLPQIHGLGCRVKGLQWIV